MLHLKKGAWCLPDVMLGIQAKEFKLDHGPSPPIAQFGNRKDWSDVKMCGLDWDKAQLKITVTMPVS